MRGGKSCAGLPFAPSVPSWDIEPGYLLVDRMCWLSWWSAATLCVSKCAMLYCYIWSCKLLCRQLTSMPGANPGQGMWLEERRSSSVIVFVRPSSCAWHRRCCIIITSSATVCAHGRRHPRSWVYMLALQLAPLGQRSTAASSCAHRLAAY
jgi:hypothetical protein